MNSYKFVDGEHRAETVIKRSRFIATVFGEADEQKAIAFIERIKKEFPDATHNCYAYTCDILGNTNRFSDDGEPAGTAGQPLLAVLKKQGLKMTAAVVTRYFGGVKLGASGLVSAYTEALVNAINTAAISEKVLSVRIVIEADYSVFSSLEGFIRKNGLIEDIEYGDGVKACVWVRDEESKSFREKILALSLGKALIKEDIKDYKVYRGAL